MRKITREQAVNEAVQLSLSNRAVLLQWATGFGKSFAAIKCQEALNSRTTYLIVNETPHIRNWHEEYAKHGKLDLVPKTKTFCYASLKKYANTEVDTIILDEGHHLSDERIYFLSTIKFKNLILLSATLEDTFIKNLSYQLGIKFARSVITLNDAINSNVLIQPKIKLIELELDAFNRNQTIIINRGKAEKRIEVKCQYGDIFGYTKAKYPDITLIVSCTEYEKNKHYDSQIDYFKKQFFALQQPFVKFKWLGLASERKRWLGELKTSFAMQLINNFKNKRYICFGASIDQIDLMSSETCIHSKKKNSLKLINDYNSKRINSLYMAKMLSEGQNLVDTDIGVIIQLDNQERSLIQRLGRLLRSSEPLLYVFYYKNTRDADFLELVKQEINNEYLEFLTYADLKL